MKPGHIATSPLIPICDRLAGVVRTLEMLRAKDGPAEPDVLLMLEDVLADQIGSLRGLADKDRPETQPPPR